MFSAIPAVVGCAAQMCAQLDGIGHILLLLLLAIGRLLTGIHGGASLALLPLFIAEISGRKQRGLLSSMQQICQSLITLIGFVIGSEFMAQFFGEYYFQLLQTLAVAPTLLLFTYTAMIPDSPVELLQRRSRPMAVEQSIRYYRGLQLDIDSVISEIVAESDINTEIIDQSHPTIAMILCNRTEYYSRVRCGLMIGTIAAASYAFTADDLIDSFSSHFLQDANQNHDDYSSHISDEITILLGIILFVTSIFGSIFVEKIGRKWLLVCGLIGTAISNVLMIVVPLIAPNYQLIGTICAFICTKAFIGIGAGAPAWFLTSELVPASCRSICQSISTGVLLIMSGLITVVYLQIDALIGNYTIVLLASAPAFASAIFLWIYLPETKNRSYDDIQRAFGIQSRFCCCKKSVEVNEEKSPLLNEKMMQRYGNNITDKMFHKSTDYQSIIMSRISSSSGNISSSLTRSNSICSSSSTTTTSSLLQQSIRYSTILK